MSCTLLPEDIPVKDATAIRRKGRYTTRWTSETTFEDAVAEEVDEDIVRSAEQLAHSRAR